MTVTSTSHPFGTGHHLHCTLETQGPNRGLWTMKLDTADGKTLVVSGFEDLKAARFHAEIYLRDHHPMESEEIEAVLDATLTELENKLPGYAMVLYASITKLRIHTTSNINEEGIHEMIRIVLDPDTTVTDRRMHAKRN
jgi:hypothetical protein